MPQRLTHIPALGTKFGLLSVACESPKIMPTTHKPASFILCVCECGGEKWAKPSDLRRGKITSCGCERVRRYRKLALSNTARALHRAKGTPEYNSWHGLRDRCLNPTSKYYRNYGARGVTVCDRWSEFTNFLSDMGLRPSPEHSIDRMDNSGPYSPENCRWATRTEQGRNRRTNRVMTIGGTAKTVTEWAGLYKVPVGRVYQRLSRGWELEAALLFAPKTRARGK